MARVRTLSPMALSPPPGPDAELRALRLLCRAIPPLPHATAIVNRALKPLYLRKPRPEVAVDTLGLRMRLNPYEAIDGAYLFYPHLYDRAEVRHLQEHLRPGDVFIDVGAHIGFYALLGARAVGPAGTVVAIEPDPVSYERLAWHVRTNRTGQVRTVNAAVSDRDEERDLAIQARGNRGGSSLGATSDVVERVVCRPLGAILDELGVDRITGMKLDIEGHEATVLGRFFADTGAGSPRRPEFMIVEGQGAGAADDELLALLAANGYRVKSTHTGNALNWVVVRSSA